MRNTEFTASMDNKQLKDILRNNATLQNQMKIQEILTGGFPTPPASSGSMEAPISSRPFPAIDIPSFQQFLIWQHLAIANGSLSPQILNPLLFPTPTPVQSSTNLEPIATTSRSPDVPTGDLFSIRSLLNMVSQSPNTMMAGSETGESLQRMSTDSIQSPLDILSMIRPPVLTPNDSLPASSPGTSHASSSSSSYKTAEKDEDEDESALFVDVESVETTVDGKDRRKAHVEFYRKMKSMRQREKSVLCAICKKKVDNVENTIQTHVSEHADAGCYQCRLCGWQSHDKYRIYEHMRKEHPRKVEMFIDKRDMPKMCQVITQCFPRITTRPKKEGDRNSETYISKLIIDMEKMSQKLKKCEICKMEIRRDKHALVRHVQSMHILKCKICKTVTTTMEGQMAHQLEVHEQKTPRISVDYAPSSAAIFLLPILEQCFPINSC